MQSPPAASEVPTDAVKKTNARTGKNTNGCRGEKEGEDVDDVVNEIKSPEKNVYGLKFTISSLGYKVFN